MCGSEHGGAIDCSSSSDVFGYRSLMNRAVFDGGSIDGDEPVEAAWVVVVATTDDDDIIALAESNVKPI